VNDGFFRSMGSRANYNSGARFSGKVTSVVPFGKCPSLELPPNSQFFSERWEEISCCRVFHWHICRPSRRSEYVVARRALDESHRIRVRIPPSPHIL
jgi:hypothetical protein